MERVAQMTADRRNWLAYLPDRALWTPALVEVVERGHYIRWNHNDDWLVLLSVKDSDVMPVQDGGRVQARLAVNRNTWEVVHPTPGIRISQWEAEIYGKSDEYRDNAARRRLTPTCLSDWDRLGDPMEGTPRDTEH